MSWLSRLSLLQTSRAERYRSPLWVWPSVSAAAAMLVATALLELRPMPGVTWARAGWPGSVDSAIAVLQTLAASVITVTSLTFTLTVVALQLASQQFSPRLLREFTRDPVTRVVLSVLVGVFVYTLTVLRALDAEQPLPLVAVLTGLALGLVALAALLGFITHIARILRVDTMMLAVHDETDRAIQKFYPAYDDPRPRTDEQLNIDSEDWTRVAASSSGFVRTVNKDMLVRAAVEADAVVQVQVRPGDHVVRGTPLATFRQRGGVEPGAPERLSRAIRDSVILGYERTLEQDAGFGFRQLQDIAVKALSPGINDPVTAAHAVGHMADLVVNLTCCRLGSTLHQDEHGVGRALVPDRDLRYYLDLACSQVRRYGQRDPTVLSALLRLLRDVATAARDGEQRREVERQTRLIQDAMDPSMRDEDRHEVEDLAARVGQALRGELRAAYRDRSGETRSL